MIKQKGFTLIELLVALAIFAILSTITASALYNAFQTRHHLAQFADQLTELQVALNLMTRDFSQTLSIARRTTKEGLPPNFIGEPLHVEFIHGGRVNPLSQEKRATLTRTAFICQNSRLLLRQWESLDPAHYQDYQDRILLKNLQHCQFSYLDPRLNLLPTWRQSAESTHFVLPKAIQLSLTIKKKGTISYLFALSQAPYQTEILPS